MIDISEISHLLERGPLVAYRIDGVAVFPAFGAMGNLSICVAYVAKKSEDFPDGSFGMGEDPLSADGKFYRMEFHGCRTYSLAQVDEMLEAAEKALG